MFSLLFGFYEYLVRKDELNILIIGLDQAGKTTLLEQLKGLLTSTPGLEPNTIVSTVGLNVGRAELHNTRLVLWDLGGRAGLQRIWEKYYAEAHAVAFVVDAADPQRLPEARAALDGALSRRELFDAPLLVLANKQDAADALQPEAVADALGLRVVISRPHAVRGVSGVSGSGAQSALQWLVEAASHSNRTLLMRSRQRRT